jgi:short-subunit dehydrogenase
MDVNFYGTYYMISTFLPHLLTRPEAHILNVSSMGGFLPVPGQALYGASKAAVRQLTTSLYTELKDTNVNVSVVIPGAMATNIKKNSHASDQEITEKDKNNKMLLSPEKAAVLIIDTIEKNKLVKYLGKDSAIMNLMMKIAPKLSMNMVTSMMATAH